MQPHSSNAASGLSQRAFCRIVGASLILLSWGAWLVYRDRDRGVGQSSLLGRILFQRFQSPCGL